MLPWIDMPEFPPPMQIPSPSGFEKMFPVIDDDDELLSSTPFASLSEILPETATLNGAAPPLKKRNASTPLPNVWFPAMVTLLDEVPTTATLEFDRTQLPWNLLVVAPLA